MSKCKKCGGTGNIGYDEYIGEHPHGGLVHLQEPCDACVCKGICPQCGERALTEADDNGENFHCEACGWAHTWDKDSQSEAEY